MSKTSKVIAGFQPQWHNQHSPTCDVTQQRKELWRDFVNDPTNEALHGAVIEYDNYGDQETENCTCYVCGKGTPQVDPQTRSPSNAPVLSVLARALAWHIEAFNLLVARNEDTADGGPRGSEWSEHTGGLKNDRVGAEELDNWNRLLSDLADLWDR